MTRFEYRNKGQRIVRYSNFNDDGITIIFKVLDTNRKVTFRGSDDSRYITIEHYCEDNAVIRQSCGMVSTFVAHQLLSTINDHPYTIEQAKALIVNNARVDISVRTVE